MIILLGCIVLPIIFFFVLHYDYILSVLLSVIITVIPIYLLYGYFYSKEATGKVNLFYAFKVFKHLTWKDIIEVFIYAALCLIMVFYVHPILGLIFNRNEIKTLISGRPFIETIRTIKKIYNLSENIDDLTKERIEILKIIFNKERIQFVAGFREFFQRIKDKYNTCVVSSSVKELFNIVDKKLDLSKLFNGRIFLLANSKGCKSKDELFLCCIKKLNSKKENTLLIDDSPSGIEAAKKAGIKCIAITTTFDSEKLKGADLVVNSFSQILKFLDYEKTRNS